MLFLRLLIAATLLLVCPAVLAQEPPSGIPRFVSLRSGEVNVRTGPGTSYPIEWVFTRKGMPVEVVAEFDVWRRIRDIGGTEGWVHRSLLRGVRTVQVVGSLRDLRRDPSPGAALLARVEPGVIAELKRCTRDWCEIAVGGYDGWLGRDEVWGVYPTETLE
jgi:SH3-like domain-containing protein